jgi:hypothetical protein
LEVENISGGDTDPAAPVSTCNHQFSWECRSSGAAGTSPDKTAKLVMCL